MANSSVSVKSPNADCHPVSLSPMNYFKPAVWHDAMSAALESSSAYAITAIAFDEKRRANPNLITLTTHADANVRCVAAT
jgi:hypothetical protein